MQLPTRPQAISEEMGISVGSIDGNHTAEECHLKSVLGYIRWGTIHCSEKRRLVKGMVHTMAHESLKNIKNSNAVVHFKCMRREGTAYRVRR